MRRFLGIFAAVIFCSTASYAQYKAVFMGDSIFDSWDSVKHGGHPEFFEKNNFLNRGKSGQVTAQMVERFESDVIAHKVEYVVICCGTNDIAQNRGYVSNRQIMKNIKWMTRTAEKSGIKVVLCTILPASRYHWRPEIKPVVPIQDMNRRIARFAKCRKRTFIDFYTPLAAADGSLPEELSKDGVHPNSHCYDIMEKIVLQALR
ncbi:MAG: acylhydrolase [Rikenellaceae bacterium]|nr:acylhydrolase [Rikenellaceae bacterium]